MWQSGRRSQLAAETGPGRPGVGGALLGYRGLATQRPSLLLLRIPRARRVDRLHRPVCSSVVCVEEEGEVVGERGIERE